MRTNEVVDRGMIWVEKQCPKQESLCSCFVGSLFSPNLINIQRLGLRLRLKKASTGMNRGLMLTVIFESYKHELDAY